MCVACVIFTPLSLRDLKLMEEDNPHGAGVAWEKNGEIRFLKGLKAKEVFDLQESGVLTYPYLLHFRWATHGDVVAELTHPFPVGPRALMGEISGTADKVLIHNGTWPSFERQAAEWLAQGNYDFPEELIAVNSDTAVAAWLAQYDETILDSVAWATAVASMRDAVLDDGTIKRVMDITTRGGWEEHQNNWFSNLNWLHGGRWGMYYSMGGTPSSTYQSFSDKYMNEDRDFVEPRDERWRENDNWKQCIKPFGYRSFLDSPSEQDRRARRADKSYVGKHNDIYILDKFYKYWYPEKDVYKPENVDWADWYERFSFEHVEDTDVMKARDLGISVAQLRGELDEDDDGGHAWGARQSVRHGQEEAQEDDNQASQGAQKVQGESSVLFPGYDPSDPESHAEDALVMEREVSLKRDAYHGRGSWHDYLVAKYGAEGADAIESSFTEDGAAGEDEEAVKALAREGNFPDPDWLVSDNPSTVNAAIARQMGEKERL